MISFRKLIFSCILRFFFFSFSLTQDLQRCDLPMGMEDGRIKNENIMATVGNDVKNIRLNKATAWCFTESTLQANQSVMVTIDLGQLTFVSGITTQGPPSSLKPASYRYSVGFNVENSTSVDGTNWSTCCGGQIKSFYAEDKPTESGVSKTQAFEMLILARRIRINILHGVRWIGDDEKCFRIEILGCQSVFSPMTNLKIAALPIGWVEATWDVPAVMIPGNDSTIVWNLGLLDYQVNVTTTQDGGLPQNISTFTQKARRVLISGPIWGVTYSISIICPYQGWNLSCGNDYVIATVQGCNPDSDPCHTSNQVVFQRPQNLRSWIIRPTTSDVYLSWIFAGSGWVTSSIRIKIINKDGRELRNDLIDNQVQSISLNDLPGTYFKVTFIPDANVGYTPSFTYDLYIVPWKNLTSTSSRTGYGAFIADVNVELNVHWEGKLLVSWTAASIGEGDIVRDLKTPRTQTSVNATSEFTANAQLYNISIYEDGHVTTRKFNNVSGKDKLETEFKFLKLETVYWIDVFCDFGGLVVKCGSSSILTGLPILVTSDSTSQLYVYVGQLGGQSWTQQEQSCRDGGGNLVSLDTEEKEKELTSVLKNYVTGSFRSFWIGLNMCPSNTGEAWSDGSKGTYNLLPERGLTLGLETCCIKSEWQTSTSRFIWVGETCSALLPAICEYKTEGLVGEVELLKRANVSTSAAAYQWKYNEDFWTPTVFNHKICPVRFLGLMTNKSHENDTRCIIKLTSVEEETYTVTGLDEFTEYNVTLSGSLPSLGITGNYETIMVRTTNSDPVIFNVLNSGFIQAIWAEKVSNFDDTPVRAILSEGDALKQRDSKLSPPGNVMFGGLTMGEKYQVQLKETVSPFGVRVKNISAYPQCDCTDCQDLGLCFTPSDKQIPESLAATQCIKEGKDLAIAQSKEQLAVLLIQAEKLVDDLWVSSTSIPLQGSSQSQCLLVSRNARAIVVASDCHSFHYAACQKTAPMSPIFPSADLIKTRTSGTWIELNWDSSNSGWKVNYTVYYPKDNQSSKVKRDVDPYMKFNSPPVIVRSLEKDTPYAMTLVAELGKGFVDSVDLTRRTTNSSGECAIRDTMDDPWLSAEWSGPDSRYFIAQLICGSLLIVCCIVTMIFIFSTGMFYQDCMAHLGFLFSLLMSYGILLFAHPPCVDDENLNACVVVAAFLHYFFLTTFLFLCLEALTLSHLLVERIQSPFQSSNWLLMGTGFVIPLVYVGITVGIINVKYAKMNHVCWLNVDSASIYVQCIPNGILLIITIVLILITITSDEDNQPLLKDNDIKLRQNDCYKIRWVILALAIELGIAWSAGTAGYYSRSKTALAVHDAFILLLAITIIFARTWFDDTFRRKIHRLCCGTELTYKRSAIKSISARTRVAPAYHNKSRASSGFSTTTVKSKHITVKPSFQLPNTPPESDFANTILIKRSYKFDDDF